MGTSRKLASAGRPDYEDERVTCEFEQVTLPGAYVHNRTGDLLRFPEDALAPNRSPVIAVSSKDPWILTRISDDAFVPATKARMIAANLDLPVNF